MSFSEIKKKENFEVSICNVRETEHLCLVFDLSDGVSLGVMCIILVECVCVCVSEGPFWLLVGSLLVEMLDFCPQRLS